MTPRDLGKQPDLIFIIVRSPWFALLDLCMALFSGWLIFARPGLQGWPLLLALLPWVARLAGGRPAVKPPRYLGWLLLFLLSAGVGVWASYDPSLGWNKFWLLLASVVTYISLANQPLDNLRPSAAILAGVAALLAVYFMLTHNWATSPADIGFVNRLALGWLRLRPQVDWSWLHPNLVGGLIALFAPLHLWLLVRSFQKRRWLEAGYALLTGSIALTGLLFSSSRGSWLALAIALVAWLIFELDTVLGENSSPVQQWILRGVTIAVLLLAGGLALARSDQLAGLLGHLPGPDSSVSRLEIYRNTLRLVERTPYTGAGLGTFAAQYSEYILLIPVYMFGYAHNLYLDLAVEQGLPGLAIFLIVLAGSLHLILNPPAAQVRRPRRLRGALLACVLVMLLHGLVDDSLYGAVGTPLVFVIPGMAVALAGQVSRTRDVKAAWLTGRLPALIMLAGLSLVLIVGLISRRPLVVAWYVNRGAVEMARSGLQGFPTAGWDETTAPERYALSAGFFERALTLDPDSVGALYRLGLLAMRQRDFPRAQWLLERALALDAGHYGARKALGYCYTWLGRSQGALALLRDVPEARREMEAYDGWWSQQARPDLAEKARGMMSLLSENR